jgi:hypothetical protein
VFAFIGEHALSVPSYSKQTKLGDKQMTDEQYYEYVQKAGPRLYDAIRRNIPRLRRMNKEQMQEEIGDIATKVKKQVRSEMRRGSR